LAYDGDNFINAAEDEADRSQFIWVPLSPIGTEGQTAQTGDEDPDGKYPYRNPPAAYKLWQISIPFGVTFDFIINKSWTIGIEGSFRFTLTDYLDDVSGNYWDRHNFHASISDVNPEIQGKLGNGIRRDNIILPTNTNVISPSSAVLPINTAALLANPSLANAVGTDPNTGEVTFNPGANDANTFPTARKGDANRDWFAFFGVKASKVFGQNRYQKKNAQTTTEPKY